MKKKLSFIVFSFILISSAVAFEWGGTLKNDSRVSINAEKLVVYNQTNSLNVWLSVPITKDNVWNFYVEGNYKFLLRPVPKPVFIINILDIPLLKVSGQINVGNVPLKLAVGRFKVTDFTSKIINNTCDGVLANAAIGFVNIDAYFGFTGLTNQLTSSGFLAKNGTLNVKNGNLYVLDNPFIPAIVKLSLPSIFANQSIVMQGLVAIDCSEEKNSKYYATVGLEGPLYSNLFYELKTTISTESFNSISNLSTIMLTWFPTRSIRLHLMTDYASGGELCFDNFRTVSSFSQSELTIVELSDALIPSAGVSFSLKNFYAYFDVKGVFSIDDDLKFKYVIAKLNSNLNLFSDLQIGFDVNGIFATSEKKADTKFSFSLKGTFLF